MIVSRLLYSRSFASDYRWVLIPPVESTDDQEDITRLLGQLNDDYDLYDRSKGVSTDRDPVLLFCRNVGDYGVLCRCGPTRYEDALGRRIFALSGLLVTHDKKKEFAAALPYLVALGDECLDVPIDLGAADADRIKNSVRSDSIGLDQLRDQLPATAQKWLRLPHVRGMTTHELRSDGDGVKCLLRLLGSPLVPWMDFAFATPARLARKMGTFDVVVGDVGLSVSAVGHVRASPVEAPSGAGPGPRRREGSVARAGKTVGHGGTEGSGENRSGRKRLSPKPPFDSSGESSPITRKAVKRQGRHKEPVLPDDFDRSSRVLASDDDGTVRIRAVTDSTYLDRVLHRVYWRFEAYETTGYVAAESERFRLSLNLERDHAAQKEALDGLLQDLYGRGYVRVADSESDWSECVLRRRRRGKAVSD